MTEKFQLFTNQDFGYSLELPETWRDVGPDIYNSTFEVARYLRTSGKLHDGIVNVFWDIPAESLERLTDAGNETGWDTNLKDLRAEGAKRISKTALKIGQRDAIRLSYSLQIKDVPNVDDVDDWVSHTYFMQIRGKYVSLNMATANIEADIGMFEHIANSFDAIEDCVGIVLCRSNSTPSAFVADLLESTFHYTQRKALQRSVRLGTQSESVVALVKQDEAQEIIESVRSKSQQAGHDVTARVVS